MIRNLLRRLRTDKKGQGLVEYALLIAGVALVAAAAVSLFGHKTSDMVGAVAAILPGAHSGDNGTIESGHLIETAAVGTSGAITLDVATIAATKGTDRLGQNILGPTAESTGTQGFNGLIIESK